MSRLARINVVPGWTMQHKTSRSCAASCRIYCALTKPPRSASRTSGSRPDSMNTIGLECLECRSLDAIALLPKGVEVDALVVPCSGLPAAVEDPYPLERQRPHGGLIRAALRSLLPVIGARPERFVDGLACPFDKGLAQEGRTLPAPVHPALLAAALGDRGDARVLLQFIGALEAVMLLAECSQQARRQMRTCSGQAVKQVEVGQRPCDCRDLPVEHVDRSARCAQLRNQDQRAQPVWCNDTGIVSKRHSAADRLQTPLNQFGPATVMRMEERFKGLSARTPDCWQSGPAGHEIAKQHRVDVLEPFQRLRI